MHRNLIAIALACGPLLTPSVAAAEILMQIRFEVTDLNDVPITSIAPGEDFLLRVLVQDVRNPPAPAGGVFSAFLNGNYDESLVTADVGEGFTYDPFFSIARTGSLATPGEITAGGAASGSLSAPGTAEQFLFHVQFEAAAPGVAVFTPSFDDTPGHDVLLYLENELILESEISFIADSLTITPEPTGLALALLAAGGFGWCRWRRRSNSRRFDRGPAGR